MKVALIATGDEVVSGQIINKNASELAKILTKEGVEVAAHFAVLDSAEDLKKTLHFIKSELKVDCVFTIGGLGPTRDDLTRQVVSDFLKAELVLNVQLWEELEKNLNERGITPRSGHKWQCYFSKNSQIFLNTKGTAQGFLTEGEGLAVVCLPGPPNEMKSVLENGLLGWIKSKSKPSLKLYTWQCINIPESDLSDKIETVLKGCDYQVGFRAYPPITEVKLWVPMSVNYEEDEWIKKVFSICKDTLYSTQEDSYLKYCLDHFHNKNNADIYFFDHVTNGESFDELQRAFAGNLPTYLKYGFGEKLSLNDNDSLEISFAKKKDSYQLKAINHVVELKLEEAKHFRKKKIDMCAFYVLFKKLHQELKK